MLNPEKVEGGGSVDGVWRRAGVEGMNKGKSATDVVLRDDNDVIRMAAPVMQAVSLEEDYGMAYDG